MTNNFGFGHMNIDLYDRLGLKTVDSISKSLQQINNVFNQTNHQYYSSVQALSKSLSSVQNQYISSLTYYSNLSESVQLSIAAPIQRMAQVWNKDMLKYMQPMQSTIDTIAKVNSQNFDYLQSFYDSINMMETSMTNAMNSILSSLSSTNLEWINRLNDILTTLNYDINENTIEEYNASDLDVLVDEFTTAIVAEDILNWEQRFMKIYDEFKENHPVIVRVFIGIVFFLITHYAGMLLPEIPKSTTVRLSSVYVGPNPSSDNILNLSNGETVYIVDNIPYWYEIEYIDEESGEIYCGWVAKKNLSEENKTATLGTSN